MKILTIILTIVLCVFFYVIGYATGWHSGFSRCDQVWEEQLENCDLVLKE